MSEENFSYSCEFDQALDRVIDHIENGYHMKISSVVLFGSLSHSKPRLSDKDKGILASDADLLIIVENENSIPQFSYHYAGGFSKHIPYAQIFVQPVAELQNYLVGIKQACESPDTESIVAETTVFLQALATGIPIRGVVPEELSVFIGPAEAAFGNFRLRNPLGLVDATRRELTEEELAMTDHF